MTDALKARYRHTLVRILSANPRVEKVVLFGSRAMGSHSPASDIDLALFGEGLTLDDLLRLRRLVDETSIPQRVDLVLAKAIDNPRLRDHIRRHGVLWYERTPAAMGDQPSTRSQPSVV